MSNDRTTSLPEQALDRAIGFIEGPANRAAERLFKSRLLLTPMGLGWMLYCRTALALRDGKPSRLWRGATVAGTQSAAAKKEQS
ncbi:MAG: hypothetical protein P1V51_03595 [Deltaproteobacteria bacterium]|nr:hypothetical protein [Deltaproteobacteria bacterium]